MFDRYRRRRRARRHAEELRQRAVIAQRYRTAPLVAAPVDVPRPPVAADAAPPSAPDPPA